MKPLRLGTRGSKLAMAQSATVADAVRAHTGRDVELVEITTAGDRSTAPIATLGGTGVFVSALRDALSAGQIDFAVHSYKDLPTAAADGLVIAAVPERADPRDVLISRGHRLAELPPGATVGTGAPRRIAQLRAVRPDLVTVAIRGNVDTRLAKVTDGELDAVVLAAAGLARLGRSAEVTEALDPAVVVPAPAQGALAIECRAGDDAVLTVLTALDDSRTRSAVRAERSLLAALEAGCSAPVGAHAVVAGDTLHLTGAVVAIDGSTAVRRTLSGTTVDAEDLGRRLAAVMISAGADTLMGSTT